MSISYITSIVDDPSGEIMDLGRFHYALDMVVRDMRRTQAGEQLQNIINQLSNVVNNPSQPAFIEQYKQQLDVAKQALESSNLNEQRLEIADFLENFDLVNFVGLGFFNSIISTIAEHQLSPHSALNALQKLQENFSKKLSNLTAINSAFTAIGAPYDEEPDGDSEIEIKIPADYETKTLEDLSREAKEWHRDISTISEVFDPDRPETTVRTLSTGSWEFYLASAPLVIFGFAKCLKGINSILSELIKSKKLLGELRGSNAPKKIVSDYESHLNKSVGTDLNNLAIALVDEFYKGSDDGRRAELKNALMQSLKRLSKKLSEGSKVSLRLSKPAAPRVADEESPTQEESAAIADASRVEKIREETLAELRNIRQIEHDPDIAKALPAPDSE